MKQVAIIDMGTNTFHLMLADISAEGFTIHYREKVPVKIGVGGINEGFITEEAMGRAIKCMIDFKNTIQEAHINTVMAFGTSALRNARNSSEIINKIETATGITISVINGMEEANYIYKGAKAAVKMGLEKCLVMDIGGGSVEFIVGDSQEIFWSHSFEIGGQRLLEKFQKHDPITTEEINALNRYFEQELKILFNALNDFNPKILIGSSGTFDTLSDIYCLKNDLPLRETPETPFSIDAFYEIFEELKAKDKAARMQIPGMIELRVDMIVVACCLIRFILTRHHFNQVRVSSYSLKEGVLASLLEEIK